MRVPTEYLSPDDFEKFANRIVEKIFEKRILSFGEGADGGIDGIDDTKRPSIVVQSKRYQPSTAPSIFLNTIRDELAKLVETSQKNGWGNDFDYVVVTSVRLNPETRRRVRELKPEWIKSEQHIIDGESLRSFSELEEYKEIFENYNLIGIDFKTIIENFNKGVLEVESAFFFERFSPKFVAITKEMRIAYEVLLDSHLVFLTGYPGVGKTTTSQCLGALFNGHRDIKTNVLVKSITEIPRLIELFSYMKDDSSEKLLIIFDDFVGRNSFCGTDSDLLNVRKIVSLSQKYSNLYLVFNSRTPILDEANRQNLEFSNFFDDIESEKKITLDISSTSDEDKARILRLNFEKCYSSATGERKHQIEVNYSNLLDNKNYMLIIRHRNYNPRIIETFVREARESQETFTEKALKFLDAPNKLYEELFNKLSGEEKLLLYLSASIYEQKPISYIFLEQFFSDFNTSSKLFDDLFDDLYGFWLKKDIIVDSERQTEKIEIEFINPSVYDFLKERIKTPSFERLLDNKSQYLLPIYLLNNNSEVEFEDYISDNQRFKRYLDKDRFLGNKLLSLLKKNIITTEDVTIFKESLLRLSEISCENSGLFPTFKKIPEVIEKLCESENTCLQKTFISEFLYSSYNQNLIVGMDLELSKLLDLLVEIDNLMIDCVGKGLSQNEVVDLAEEETGVNVFGEVTRLVEHKLIDNIDGAFLLNWYGIVEDYLSKNSIDPLDFVDPESERSELVDNIFEYYFEYILKEDFVNLLDIYDNLDIDKIYEIAVQCIENELEEHIYPDYNINDEDLRELKRDFYMEENRIEKATEQERIREIMSEPLGF